MTDDIIIFFNLSTYFEKVAQHFYKIRLLHLFSSKQNRGSNLASDILGLRREIYDSNEPLNSLISLHKKRSFLQMWPHLLKKFLLENFIFCTVFVKIWLKLADFNDQIVFLNEIKQFFFFLYLLIFSEISISIWELIMGLFLSSNHLQVAVFVLLARTMNNIIQHYI